MKDFLASTDLWRIVGGVSLVCALAGHVVSFHTESGSLFTMAGWFSYMLSINILTWYEKPREEQRVLNRRAKILFSLQVLSILTALLLFGWQKSTGGKLEINLIQSAFAPYSLVLIVSVICYLGLTKWHNLGR